MGSGKLKLIEVQRLLAQLLLLLLLTAALEELALYMTRKRRG